MAPGIDFIGVLNDRLAQCDILISVIGDDWSDVCDDNGARRFDNPDDLVRIEIESAFQYSKCVIPVLIGQAQMPRSDQLPETITAFARLTAVRLTHERFRAALKRALKSAEDARAAQACERKKTRI